MSLYGGLEQNDPELNEMENMLASYAGKMFVSLANSFDFFGRGAKTILGLCEPHIFAELIAWGTNCLFLNTKSFSEHTAHLNRIVFGADASTSDLSEKLTATHRFSCIEALVTELNEQKRFGAIPNSIYIISVGDKHQGFFNTAPEAYAKKVASSLQKHLPSDRCMVSYYAADLDTTTPKGTQDHASNSSRETETNLQILVSFGAPYHASVAALEPASRQIGNHTVSAIIVSTTESALGLPERYVIASPLRLEQGIELLWQSATVCSSSACSPFALKALTLSLVDTIHLRNARFPTTQTRARLTPAFEPRRALFHIDESSLRALFAGSFEVFVPPAYINEPSPERAHTFGLQIRACRHKASEA